MVSFGEFTKDGMRREAFSPTEAVKLKATGWKPADAVAEQTISVPAPPPKAGLGSGTQAWAAYAERLGVDVHDDASREDIQAALVAAGHPVE